MKQEHTQASPLSYSRTNNDTKQSSKLLSDFFPGYETCNSVELFDATTQTDFHISDWNEQFEGRIEELVNKTRSIHSSLDLEEFIDVIESENEEFLSAGEEQEDETYSKMPHYINIQLKDPPYIVVDNGLQKTKISLTPEYLQQNGLELVIGEGPNKNIKLKSGEKEIYLSDKGVLPHDVNISVTDEEEPGEKQDIFGKRSERGNEPDVDVTPDVHFQTSKLRIGLMSLVVDELEQQYYSELFDKDHQDGYPGYKIIKCVSDEEYKKLPFTAGNDDKKKENFFKDLSEHRDNNNESNPKKVKDEKIGNYSKVKNNFFWTGFEGDPTIDLNKQGVMDESAKHDFQFPPREPPKKSIEIQTVVHINPSTTSEDFTFTHDSDSFSKRFSDSRGHNSGAAYNHDEQASFQRKHGPNGKKKEKTNTHEATIGQIESDFSTKTEPTLEGIPELTERNDTTKVLDVDLSSEKGDITEEDVSEISDRKIEKYSTTPDIKIIPKATESEKEGDTAEEDLSQISNQKADIAPSAAYVEKVSKATDTCGLDGTTEDVAVLRESPISSPSLLKALKCFEEALSPLNEELSRLHSEFKSIDIEELRLAVTEPPALQAQIDNYPTPPASHRSFFEPFHELYGPSNSPSPEQHSTPVGRCSCPPGTCLGIRRSSGVECQRIRRLPPQATSFEFLREFTRLNWDRNNIHRTDSIWSEPEDILGDQSQQPSTSRNNVKHNNKTEKF